LWFFDPNEVKTPENLKKAQEKDLEVQEAWKEHTCHKVIPNFDNDLSMDKKMKEVEKHVRKATIEHRRASITARLSGVGGSNNNLKSQLEQAREELAKEGGAPHDDSSSEGDPFDERDEHGV